MKIYTKKGDDGNSALLDSKAFEKHSLEFEVLGTLDELNSTLGFVQTSRQKDIKEIVLNVQNELFEIGTIISGKNIDKKVWESRLSKLEKTIDDIDSKNINLKSFILPGGSSLSSQLHLSRAVCRRLERRVVELCKKRRSDIFLLQNYLNRLSDLLFVLARYANKKLGIKDILWKKD